MTSMVFRYLLFMGLSMTNTQENCKWELQFQSQTVVLDLSPLSGSTIHLQEQQYPQYYLEFTPCVNNIKCSCYTSKPVMAAQITDVSNPTQCNGVLAEFDSNTQPSFSMSGNGVSQFTFDYPGEPNVCNPGCDGGRKQSITYICDINGTAQYNKDKSRFYESDKINNQCEYHLELYTKYACVNVNVSGSGVKWIVTSTDKSKLFAMQFPLVINNGTSNKQNVLTINEATTYQKMYGFGAALTQSSAYLLGELKSADSTRYWQLMDTLFNKSMDNDQSFGINVLRYPISACDFILPNIREFTMDDTYGDYDLSNMSLINAADYQIPILLDIMKINPYIKLIGSPWTGLPWLKTSANKPYPGNFDGGEILDDDKTYQTYGNFFLKLLQLYKSQYNVSFFGLTLQNEPLYEPNNYPGMGMSAQQQIKLINVAGPLLQQFFPKVKIMVYDHNWDVTDYAITVLSDSTASKYADGTAWHCYAGDVSAQSTVHNKFPDKETFFTECATFNADNFESDMEWAVKNLWLGSTNNWAGSVDQWNLVLDQNYGPHHGGCGNCRGAFRLDTSQNYKVINFETIYGLGHYGKYINPDVGATRLNVNMKGQTSCLSGTSWKNNDKDGKVMVMVNNFCGGDVEVGIQRGQQYVEATVPNGIATFLW
eukprot:162719_1